MRDVDERRRKTDVKFGNFGTHLRTELCVQVGQRLVEQEYFGFAHDRTSERNTLTLTAGKSLRLTGEIISDAENVRRRLDLFVNDVLGNFSELQTERHVIINGHVRIERVVLEHHRNISVLGNDVVDELAVDIKFARRNLFETRDHTQRRGLTATGRSDEYDELFIPNIEAEVEHCLVSAGINFVDAFE